MILGISWLPYYNLVINWKIEKVKITRYSKEFERQWRPEQEKSEWQKQKKKKRGKKWKKEVKKIKLEKEKTIKIKRVIEEWKFWNEKEKAVMLEKKTKKLVSLRFYKWIQIFKKKASEKIPIKKIWDHIIEIKERFIQKKRKSISLVERRKRN